MKAAVFRGLGAPLAIESQPVPQAETGEIVLRVDYCGVCGSDLHATHPGVFVVPDGTVLGHEFAGQVVQSADPEFRPGDMVTALPLHACDECRRDGGECKRGLGMLCPNNTITGFAPVAQGAYAEYVKVHARHGLKLPPGVDARVGAMVEPLAVGLQAVEKGHVGFGDRALVLGAGPIGLAVAMFAKLAGAGSVIVSDYAAGRRAIASAFGATGLIDPAQDDVAASFAAQAGGPPDVVFECVGVPGMIRSCLDLSRPNGRIVLVGVCMSEDSFVPMAGTFKGLSLHFMLGYDKRHFQIVLDLLAAGRIDPTPMITATVGLDELPAVFEALRTPSDQVKVLVQPAA